MLLLLCVGRSLSTQYLLANLILAHRHEIES